MTTADRALTRHRDLVISTLLRTTAIVVSIAASIVVARLGGPDAKGVASSFAAVATTSFALASLGVPEQVVQLSTTEGLSARRLLLRAWLAYTVLAATLACIAAFFNIWTAMFTIGSLIYLIPAQASLAALGFSGVRVQAIGALLQPVGLCFAAVFLGLDGTLTGAEAALATAFSYLIPLAVYWRAIPPTRSAIHDHLPTIWTILRKGSKWQLPQLSMRLVERSDIIVVYIVLGPARAGIYSVASQLSELCLIVPRQVAGQTYHHVVTSKPLSLRRDTIFAVASAVAAGIIIGTLGGFAISVLYGDAFGEARDLLLLLIPGPALGSLALVLSFYFRGKRTFRPSAMASISAAIISLVITVSLVPILGAAGAAIGSTVGWACFSITSVGALRAYNRSPNTP